MPRPRDATIAIHVATSDPRASMLCGCAPELVRWSSGIRCAIVLCPAGFTGETDGVISLDVVEIEIGGIAVGMADPVRPCGGCLEHVARMRANPPPLLHQGATDTHAMCGRILGSTGNVTGWQPGDQREPIPCPRCDVQSAQRATKRRARDVAKAKAEERKRAKAANRAAQRARQVENDTAFAWLDDDTDDDIRYTVRA